jgi:hypothetical protein
MQVVIRKITPFRSQHGGHDCFRLDGFHENEFGELVKGYTFIDPLNDNAVNWVRVIQTHLEHRGEDLLVEGVRMKNRDKGIYNADSNPVVIDRIPRNKQ